MIEENMLNQTAYQKKVERENHFRTQIEQFGCI
jgi:hypothetical protein